MEPNTTIYLRGPLSAPKLRALHQQRQLTVREIAAKLDVSGEIANEKEDASLIHTPDVVERASTEHGFSEDETLDYVEILDTTVRHIKINRGMHPDRIRQLGHFRLLDKGLLWYYKTFVEESGELEKAAYAAIANGGEHGDLKNIAAELGAPILLIRLVATKLAQQNAILLSNGIRSEHYTVLSAPVLRRAAANPLLVTEMPSGWQI